MRSRGNQETMHMEEVCFEEMYSREQITSLCKKAPRMLRSHPILVEEGGCIRIEIVRKCIRERDNLHIALEEKRLLREHDDEEMRKKLKVSYGGLYCI